MSELVGDPKDGFCCDATQSDRFSHDVAHTFDKADLGIQQA